MSVAKPANPLNSVHAGPAALAEPTQVALLGAVVRDYVFSTWGVGLSLLSIVAVGVRFGAPAAATATVVWLMFFTLVNWVGSAFVGARAASGAPRAESQAPRPNARPAPSAAPIAPPARPIPQIQGLIQALQNKDEAAVTALLQEWENLPFPNDEERIGELWKVFEEHVQPAKLQAFFLFAARQILQAINKLSKAALQRNPRMANPIQAPFLRAVQNANVRNVQLILQHCSISDDLYKLALSTADRANEELLCPLLRFCVGRSNVSLASFTEALYCVSAADREKVCYDEILKELLESIPPSITWKIIAEAACRAVNDARIASITGAVLHQHKMATAPDENSFQTLFGLSYKKLAYPHNDIPVSFRKELCQMDMSASTAEWAFREARLHKDDEAVEHLLSKKKITDFTALTSDPQTAKIWGIVQAYIAKYHIIEETLDGFQTGALRDPNPFREVVRYVYKWNRAPLATLRAKDLPAPMAEIALEEAARNGDQDTVDWLLSKKLITNIAVFNTCFSVFDRNMSKFRTALKNYVAKHQIVEEALDALEATGWQDSSTFNAILSYIFESDKKPLPKLQQMKLSLGHLGDVHDKAHQCHDGNAKAWAKGKMDEIRRSMMPAAQAPAAT